MIFRGNFKHITDMNQFKGQYDIPDRFIDDEIRTINIQLELVESAKRLLKPKASDLYKVNGRTYLDGVVAEKPLFNQQVSTSTVISINEGKSARLGSVGLKFFLSSMKNSYLNPKGLNKQS